MLKRDSLLNIKTIFLSDLDKVFQNFLRGLKQERVEFD
jgi:hypothetical protein